MDLALRPDGALRLACSENPDGVTEVLVCLTSRLINSRNLYIYCLGKDGSRRPRGGGSPIPRCIGAYRQIDAAVAIASWKIEGDRAAVRFLLTDDRKAAQEQFMRLLRLGNFSRSGRDWKKLLDLDRMRLTPDERIEVFVRLWSEIKYNFANFDLVPQLDWDRILKDVLPMVRRDQSNKEFHRLLLRCVALLHDGHTEVSMSVFPAFESARPPVEIGAVGGVAAIAGIGDTPELAGAGLSRGDVVTHAGGRSIGRILEADIYPYLAASTPQWRDLRAYPLLLRGRPGSKVTLRVRGPDGNGREVSLTRVSTWREAMPRKKPRAFEHRDLDDGIAYVAINTFATRRVVDRFDETVPKLGKAKGLIIDVRENNGGRTGHGDAVIGRLIDKPIAATLWKTPQHVAAFAAWGRPKKWHVGEKKTIDPREPPRYGGPIVVLIGPETVSAGEDFVVRLHAAGRATLVGEKTAGSTGQPLLFSYPYGISGRICTKRDTYPDGREFVGVGIIPDVEVHPEVADLRTGRDRVLEKGIEVLKGMAQGQ